MSSGPSSSSTASGVVGEDHVFVTPKRAITKMEDMPIWGNTEAYHEYTGFIQALNDSVKGKPASRELPKSDVIDGVVDLLNTLDKWIDEVPPVQQPQRFGNQAFRTWFKRLVEGSEDLLQKALPVNHHRAILELKLYLEEGFGNATRIDYGTGHEMAFLWLMCCLFKIGALDQNNKGAVVFKVFNRYLQVVRKLQLTYRMEPAGSHGVWSLDDYQFMPFVWGSAQLVAHPKIEPKSFLQPEIIDKYKDDFLFISSIDFINKVKTGPFAEHSNQLWNVSAVSSWTKVNQGLIKMYKAEVLNKFPVVQHVLFGSLMSFKIVDIKPASRTLSMQPPKPKPVV